MYQVVIREANRISSASITQIGAQSMDVFRLRIELRCDPDLRRETYLKVRGEWVYLYRAVDKAGQTVDFRLSRRCDVAAAKAFFKKALRRQGRPPHTIACAQTHELRFSKDLNNLIEQGHRRIKSRTRPMLGFKNFASAATTIAGIGRLRRIHKDQFAVISLRINSQAAPAL
jgi:transposase-like protein